MSFIDNILGFVVTSLLPVIRTMSEIYLIFMSNSISDRYRPFRNSDGPIMVQYRFKHNTS